MKIKLSIIIPCYNIESCIEDLLFSLNLEKNPEVEYIIINDGSTDRTGNRIINFLEANKGLNINYFLTNNGGLSNARNFGIEKSNGEYVWFLDGDDVLRLGAVQEIINLINSNFGIDIIAFSGFDFEDRVLGNNILNYTDKNEWLIESYNRGVQEDILVISSDYVQKKIQEGEYLSNACFYILRRETILQTGVLFLPNLIYEDVLFTVHLFFHNLNCLITNKRLILHRRRIGSIMRSKLTRRNIDSFYRINNELLRLIPNFYNFRNELYMLIEFYFKLGLRRTRDHSYSIFPYFFRYNRLFIFSFVEFISVREEIYKNLKNSIKLILKPHL